MDAGTTGWGIVGLGKVAREEIAPALTSLPGSTLAAVAGRDADRAAQFAATHGAARSYGDYQDLLEDPGVQVVYVATPNALHAEQVVRAARAGRHVLCDKPLALDAEQARSVVQECRQAGVLLGLMFQTRRQGGVAEVRDAIAAGEIGRVVAVSVEMGTGRTLLKGWRTDPALAGAGTTNNLGVHAYDLLSHLLGQDVVEVTAMTAREEGLALETVAMSLLRMSGGALAQVNVNQSVAMPFADVVVHGTKGRVVGRGTSRMNMRGTWTVSTAAGERTLDVDSFSAYRDTLADFADAVRSGREPSPSGLDGLRSVEVVAALTRSAAEGRTVEVSAAVA